MARLVVLQICFGLPVVASEDPLVDVTAAVGLDFVHFIGASGELYFVENMGSGAALFDYDNDGDLDLYLVQGAMLGAGKKLDDATFPFRGTPPPSDRLYRNDRRSESAEPPFELVDVTAESGLLGLDYGMGVAAGDVDGDGWIDLYVTAFGSNRLWHNDGPGDDGRVTFSDRTTEAGVGESRWSVPALFFDYDRDGWLDLYVGNYTSLRLASNKVCTAPAGYRDYCSPNSYDPEPDRLFRNRGDGTFEDVSESAGLAGVRGNALGAVAADFDADGWLDLYVANDQMPNRLWRNRGGENAGSGGAFSEEALLAGAAVNAMGTPEASMGVDAADFDGDGDVDLFMTHLGQETNTLFVNDGAGNFEDRTLSTGLGAPSWSHTGFGTAFFDYDNDGYLDLLAVNGSVFFIPELLQQGDPYPLHEPNQLYRNDGGKRFVEVVGVEALALSEVSRGAAFGDIDNDGDTDVVITNNNGPARLLLNTVGQGRPWIGLRLVDRAGRVALGAKVALVRPDGESTWRNVRIGGSYASSSDPRVLFGVDPAAPSSSVLVQWPSGGVESFSTPKAETYTELREGTGRAGGLE